MCILGIGTDIVEIARIKAMLQRFGKRFVERILSEAEQHILEQSKDPAAFLAKRFAAKEAVAKALGTGIGQNVAFNEISVTNLPNGKPEITLLGKARALGENKKLMITLADERQHAIAFAILALDE